MVQPSTGWFAGPEHAAFDLVPEPGAARGGSLLLHGFGGTPAEMRPLAEALVRRGLSARTPLLPGFGAGMHQLAAVSADDWLATAFQAWAEVTARHPSSVLIGYSMGAALALRMAVARPPARLVLLAPLWRLLGAAWPLGAVLPVLRHVIRDVPLIRSEAALAQPDMRQFITRAAPDLDLDAPAIRQELRRRMRLPTSSIAHLWGLAISAGHAARAVQVPTLLIQGATDPVVRPRDTRQLATRLGGPIQLHELAGGHLLLEPGGPDWDSVRELVVTFACSTDKDRTDP
jgi:carboxylesterase